MHIKVEKPRQGLIIATNERQLQIKKKKKNCLIMHSNHILRTYEIPTR